MEHVQSSRCILDAFTCFHLNHTVTLEAGLLSPFTDETTVGQKYKTPAGENLSLVSIGSKCWKQNLYSVMSFARSYVIGCVSFSPTYSPLVGTVK